MTTATGARDEIQDAFARISDRLHLVRTFVSVADDAASTGAEYDLTRLANGWSGIVRALDEVIEDADLLEMRVKQLKEGGAR